MVKPSQSGAGPTQADMLAEPFDPKKVKFKAQTVKNNRALAVGYIDARLVMERLDFVLGTENWQDEYNVLGDGSVICSLRIRFVGPSGTVGDWVTKQDVGSLSEQPDAGDRLKAAFSDAFKRAAVKFGIGRYLYGLPAQWVDYDPVKKMLLQQPLLPDWAVPGPMRKNPPGEKNGKLTPEDETIIYWTEEIQDLGQTLDGINKLLSEASKIPTAHKFVRERVWEMLQGCADTNGWKYSQNAGRFIPASAGAKA